MRSVIGRAAALILLVFTISATAQDVGILTPQLTYTIPGLDRISMIKFADVNSDGLKEVLASDNHTVIVYDIAADSVLFSLEIDTTDYIHGVVFDDINRDSLVDVVLAEETRDEWVFDNFVFMFDGADQWQTYDSMQFEPRVGLLGGTPYGLSINSADVNTDDFAELVISYDSVVQHSFFGETTEGVTGIYYDFPSGPSISWSQQIQEFYPLPAVPGLPRLLTSEFYYDYSELGVDNLYRVSRLRGYDSTGLLSPPIYGASVGWCFSYKNTHERYAHYLCSVPTDTSLIIVLWTSYSEYCYDDMADTATSHSGTTISAYEMLPEVDPGLLWTTDWADKPYKSCVYHSSHPGQFFCFKADTAVLVDAHDGSIMRRYGTVPSDGSRTWDKPYTDGADYLVVIEGTNVTYLAFDVVTDVEDNPALNLPSRFTLGAPYPNPFNPTVSIPVSLNRRAEITVSIYNMLGQRVDAIAAGSLPAGSSTIQWNAETHPSGVYLFKVSSGDEAHTVKGVLLK